MTRYIYSVSGELVAEYVERTSAGIVAAIDPPPGRQYVFADHLGSTRLVTDATGACQKRTDYQPFGAEIPRTAELAASTLACYAGVEAPAQMFTGKERDAETGLDYFGARYMSAAQGRFTSPDDPLVFADFGNPQSWNLYSYGYNNPMLYSDPDGHEPCENGVNPENGNFCVVGTASKPKVETQSSPIGPLIIPLLVTTVQIAQKTQELVQPIADWWSRPRDPLCTAGFIGVGATIGFWGGGGLGTLGLAGGPTAAATIPGGAAGGTALGGAIGGFGGLVLCSTGAGGGSSGGGSGGGGFKKPKAGLSGKEAASDVPRLGKRPKASDWRVWKEVRRAASQRQIRVWQLPQGSGFGV